MPGLVIPKPTSLFPDWVKPENASVFDPGWRGPLRTLIGLLGLDDPNQVMMAGAAMEAGSPGGGMLEKLGEKFPRVAKAIKAYHGSPHDFAPKPGAPLGRFDMSKLGTGEGAQAFGHGHYVAEQEGVARGYRDELTRATYSDPRQHGQLFFDELAKGGTIQGKVPVGPNQTLMSAEQMQDAFASGRITPFHFSPTIQQRVDQAIIGKGKMYEVNIHADSEHMLDWDKSWTEQTPHVQKALQQIGVGPPKLSIVERHPGFYVMFDEHGSPINSGKSLDFLTKQKEQMESGATMSGADLYQAVAAKVTGAPVRATGVFGRAMVPEQAAAASEALRDVGVPGTKYLDASSRAAGEGSRNYVVFDDKTIEILKKYGILLPAAGLASHTQKQP